MSRVSVWITLPNTTCPTSAGSTPARLTASRTTAAARSVGGMSFRLPPYFPIGRADPGNDNDLTSCSHLSHSSLSQPHMYSPPLIP